MELNIHNTEILVLALSNLLLELEDLLGDEKNVDPLIKEFYKMAFEEFENLRSQLPSEGPIKKPTWK